MLLLGDSPWRANIAPCHTVVRRGEQMTSKHCSLLRYSSPWRTMTDFCRKVRFFIPKIQFSSTPIPNLIGNSTCDHSTIWTSIIHNSMDFLHLLTANSTCSIINSNFKPKSSNSQEQQQNYMLNSLSELHNLRLENVSPTLTLYWWLQDSTSSPFSWFSSPLSPKNFLCKPSFVWLLLFFLSQQIFYLTPPNSNSAPLQVLLF